MLRGRAPTFADTRDGPAVMPSGQQLRYWSFCQYEPATQRVIDCRSRRPREGGRRRRLHDRRLHRGEPPGRGRAPRVRGDLAALGPADPGTAHLQAHAPATRRSRRRSRTCRQPGDGARVMGRLLPARPVPRGGQRTSRPRVAGAARRVGPRLRPLMAPITVSARSGAPEETAADTRVVGVFEGESLDGPGAAAAGGAGRGEARAEEGRGGARGRSRRRPAPRADRRARRAATSSAPSRRAWPRRRRRRARRSSGAVSLSWAAPPGDGVAAGLVEGTLLKLYSFDRFKSKPGDANGGVESLEVAGDGVDADEVESAPRGGASRRTRRATSRTCRRTWRRRPSWPSAPTEIAEQHEALEVELLDREAIVARGMGAFASVAQGSHVEPRLIVLRYRPAGRERAAPRLRREGGDVRHRRDLDQALGEDAGDEVRHVGRRGGHRVDGRDRGARPAGAR